MKTKLNYLVIVMLLISTFGFSQSNSSNGGFLFTIPPSLPPGNIEAFRFRPGLITQIDIPGTGLPFNFGTETQWLSAGKLNTGSQTLYGLRVQRGGKGLVMGYTGPLTSTGTSLTSSNPFIQWVGNDLNLPATDPGNLEFRASTSSSNPASDKLVMTLRADATALFGQYSALIGCTTCTVNPPLTYRGTNTSAAAPSVPSYVNPKVEINSLDKPALSVSNLTTLPPNFRIVNGNVAGLFNQINS